MAKILVVDDENETLTMVHLMLRHAGFDVILARAGVEALALAATERPDLVLCDLVMSGMNGFDVVAAIRADVRLCHVPIVMVSAAATSVDRERALALGANEYMTKPFTMQEMTATIRRYLERPATGSVAR